MTKVAIALAVSALILSGCTDPVPSPEPTYSPEPIESGQPDGPPQFEQPSEAGGA